MTVIIEPAKPATHSVIWLHGLGADGHDFEPVVPQLKLPEDLAIRFIFPHAPVRPVTINGLMPMRAWYDIKSLTREGLEDEEGIRDSEKQLSDLIEVEIAKGIPSPHIVLAGFSQGGAVALQTALRYESPLAGVLALSTYLPLAATLAKEYSHANHGIPVFMAHGSEDPLLPVELAELSCNHLKDLEFSNILWKTYPMEHSLCMEEIADISNWLQATLSA